jgi:hypothetical protein
MAVTISLYNHTARKFAAGENIAADTYKVLLFTAATFNAANTTLAGITKTEVATANGYTAGGQALTGVAIATVSTNDASFDANDAVWTASGGSIVASYAIIVNDTDTDDPPVAFIDFGGVQTALDTKEFRIQWNASGIIRFTVA